MPAKIVIAFKTRLVPAFVPDVRQLTPPANYKTDEALSKWYNEQQCKLEIECLQQPYTATFDEVQISDLQHKKTGRWAFDPAKPPVSLRIRAWLLQTWPKAWPHTTHPSREHRHDPQAIFVGFNPRLFLKILGIECSLPANAPLGTDDKPDPTRSNAAPLSLWYTNSDHRDVAEAVKPAEYKYLTWPAVLKARGLDGIKRYADWPGPGVDVTADLSLAIELASQLGMFSEDKTQ